MPDTRVVAGARCLWWDSIDQVATKASGLPCCPQCGSPLFEWDSEEEFMASVRERDAAEPGHEELVLFVRGRCFTSPEAAREAMAEEQRIRAAVGEIQETVRGASRFRKKPVEIEAIPAHAAMTAAREVWIDLPEWLADAYERGDIIFAHDHVSIGTLEGRMRAEPGDWIIRGVQGEIYPCKPEIFEATYDEVGP